MQCFLNFLAKRITVRTKKKKICHQLTVRAHPPTAHTAMRDGVQVGASTVMAHLFWSAWHTLMWGTGHTLALPYGEKKVVGSTKGFMKVAWNGETLDIPKKKDPHLRACRSILFFSGCAWVSLSCFVEAFMNVLWSFFVKLSWIFVKLPCAIIIVPKNHFESSPHLALSFAAPLREGVPQEWTGLPVNSVGKAGRRSLKTFVSRWCGASSGANRQTWTSPSSRRHAHAWNPKNARLACATLRVRATSIKGSEPSRSNRVSCHANRRQQIEKGFLPCKSWAANLLDRTGFLN